MDGNDVLSIFIYTYQLCDIG